MRMPRNQIRPAAAPPPKSSSDIGLPPRSIRTATENSGLSSAGKPPPKPPSSQLNPDDDDDDFLKSVVAAAGASAVTGATQTKHRQGLVLARDADGFERLMDARHVSEDAIVVRLRLCRGRWSVVHGFSTRDENPARALGVVHSSGVFTSSSAVELKWWLGMIIRWFQAPCTT